MNQLELFRKAMKHEYTNKFLYYLKFSPDLEKRIREHFGLNDSIDLNEYYGFFKRSNIYLEAEALNSKDIIEKYYKEESTNKGSFINELGVLEIPGSSYHFTRYVSPLRNAKSLKDLESFPYPDKTKVIREDLKAKVEKLHNNGKTASFWIGHMYESAWQIRGYEDFLIDMMTRPEWCEYILDRLMDWNLFAAEQAALAGCDFIVSGDDVANQRALMFSLADWRKFFKKRWEKVYSRAREIKPDIGIWYHSDGNILDIIPELLDIGVDMLNPVQPECMDTVVVKKLIKERALIDGAIGTQTTMPFGSPKEVRETIIKRIREIGYDGAYIISPTHMLEPEVPLENVVAFIETLREYN